MTTTRTDYGALTWSPCHVSTPRLGWDSSRGASSSSRRVDYHFLTPARHKTVRRDPAVSTRSWDSLATTATVMLLATTRNPLFPPSLPRLDL